MRFEIYPDHKGNTGKTRWRLITKDGKPLVHSPEAYNGVGPARRAVKAFCRMIGDATVTVVEPVKEHQHDPQ